MNSKLRYNLIAPILLMLISWVKYLNTSSIAVDDNFFKSDLFIYSSIVLFYFCLVFSFYRFYILSKNDYSFIQIVSLARWINFICLFSLPLFSSDMFSIFSYSAEIDSTNIYSQFHFDSSSLFYPYVCKLYYNTPCVYGPWTLWLGKLSQLFTSNIVGILFSFKLIYFIFFELTIYLFKIYYNSKSELVDSKFYYLLVFPLLWFQGLMQLHNDFLGIFFIILFFYYLMINKNIIYSLIALTAAILVKFIFGLFVIPFFIYLFQERNQLEFNFYRKFLAGLLFSFSLVILSYLNYIENIGQFLLPLKSLSIMGTHGSLKDIFQAISHAIEMEELNSFFNYFIIAIIATILSFHIIKYKFKNYITLSLICFSLFICFYAHRFFPWYLLVIYPLFIFKIEKSTIAWREWFIIISFGYCLQDISVQIPHHYLAYHINIGISTALGLFGIFYKFKNRFISYESE